MRELDEDQEDLGSRAEGHDWGFHTALSQTCRTRSLVIVVGKPPGT